MQKAREECRKAEFINVLTPPLLCPVWGISYCGIHDGCCAQTINSCKFSLAFGGRFFMRFHSYSQQLPVSHIWRHIEPSKMQYWKRLKETVVSSWHFDVVQFQYVCCVTCYYGQILNVHFNSLNLKPLKMNWIVFSRHVKWALTNTYDKHRATFPATCWEKPSAHTPFSLSCCLQKHLMEISGSSDS